MVPYHGGALLPIEQRYTSFTWRRFHRLGMAETVSLHEAAELVATMRLVGDEAAAFLFKWTWHNKREARRLLEHPPVWAASEPYHQANLAAVDEETGLALYRAMVEGGWSPKRTRPPRLVLDAFRSLRKKGYTLERIAEQYDLKPWTVGYWLRPRKKPNLSKRLAAVGALTI